MNYHLLAKKNPSFRERFLLTISLLSLVRIGNFISLPYVDLKVFSNLSASTNSSTTTVVTILNTFSGGGATSFSILSLGILPYINASIFLQLLTTTNAALQKLQKEEGEYGRRKLNDYTRYLTLVFALIESLFTTFSLRSVIFEWSLISIVQISLTLIAGSMIVLWFSEIITKKGLGNGSSVLICFNIVSSFPDQLKTMGSILVNQNLLITLLLGMLFLLTTVGCIYINEATVKIPLISASQLLRKVSKTSLWNTSNLPLRVNQAGVMPLVFTSSAMVILSSVTQLAYKQLSIIEVFSFLNYIPKGLLLGAEKVLYWSLYSLLVFFFTSFYSKIILDPKDIAEQFRKNSVSIKGISPGISTQNYLLKIIKRLTLINAIFLISIILFLNTLEFFLPINNLNLRGFGFTSQLILVNVLIDTFRKAQNLLNMEDRKQ